MDLRVDWRTTVDSLRKQPEQSKKTAIFATALETLAVKAFGDMGRTAQITPDSGPIYSRSQ